jgi:hypothetical protein
MLIFLEPEGSVPPKMSTGYVKAVRHFTSTCRGLGWTQKENPRLSSREFLIVKLHYY